jgi:hypothetical protein
MIVGREALFAYDYASIQSRKWPEIRSRAWPFLTARIDLAIRQEMKRRDVDGLRLSRSSPARSRRRIRALKGRIAATEGGIAVALDRIGTIRSEVAVFGPAVGAPVTIVVRSEHVARGHLGVNDVTLAVGHGEQLGGATTLIFPEPGFALQVPGHVPARRGETIAHNLPPERVHVFDTEEKVLPRSRPRPAPAIVAGPAR